MNYSAKIIAIETSGRLGSLAAAIGPEMLAEYRFSDNQRHTAELMSMLDQLCRDCGWQPSDIEQIYVSAGPGSFTGLRVGITAAKVVAFALGAKVVAVPSCDVLALNMTDYFVGLSAEPDGAAQVAVVLDAQRKQIYGSVFVIAPADGFIPGFRTVSEPAVMTPAELLERTARPLYLIGEGAHYYADQLNGPDVILVPTEYSQPRAANVHRCGLLRASAELFTEPDSLSPIYLRRPEAVDKWERLHGDIGYKGP